MTKVDRERDDRDKPVGTGVESGVRRHAREGSGYSWNPVESEISREGRDHRVYRESESGVGGFEVGGWSLAHKGSIK